jgi:AAA domain, putative AbiEii toxin, Type IV TA system
MYLKQVLIENSGPLRRVALDLAVKDDGSPKPLVLVGTNGGGKTNFLSLVTDALFEAAAVHYQNVLPAQGMGRAWFRVVGGRTTTVGATGGFSLLRFEDAGQSITYKEKGGTLDPAQVAQRLPAELQGAAQWQTEGSFKEIDVSDEKSRQLFEDGVYAYFPSSRSEIPFWLNRESIPDTEFDVFSAFAKRLRKPIFVERGLHEFKQWMISVILESRAHIAMTLGAGGGVPQLQVAGDVMEALVGGTVLGQCNLVLQKVLDDNEVRFVWLGRNNADKLAVAKGNAISLPNLDALSGGQSILLTLFGTLLRYGDQSQPGTALNLDTIQGICVVDEIDSHIHVDLQHRVLPSLIRLFPRVQFIVSSHSPLFVLGMEKEFGAEGFQLVEMPAGNVVTADTYSEFGRAMEALTATEAFNEKLLSDASQAGVPIIFVEGETDTPYLRRAAEVLQRAELLTRCELQWIGAKDDSGQGFHTGKGALDHTLSVLMANPKLTQRPILLFYDNDTNKADADYESVSVRRMPTNEGNTVIRAGIENLLLGSSITENDRQAVESLKPNGDVIIRKTLRKTELCERICKYGTEEDFAAFGPALDKIAAYLDMVAPLPPQPPGAGAAEA